MRTNPCFPKPPLTSHSCWGLTLSYVIHCNTPQESQLHPGRQHMRPPLSTSFSSVSCFHFWKDGLALIWEEEGTEMGISWCLCANLRLINLLKYLKKHNLPLIYMRNLWSRLFLLFPSLKPYSLQNKRPWLNYVKGVSTSPLAWLLLPVFPHYLRLPLHEQSWQMAPWATTMFPLISKFLHWVQGWCYHILVCHTNNVEADALVSDPCTHIGYIPRTRMDKYSHNPTISVWQIPSSFCISSNL